MAQPSDSSPVPELGQEYPPPGEEALISKIEQIVKQKYERDYSGKRPALRDQHPKSHGCVRAEFTVQPDLADTFKFGIFKEPRAYPAWIRFSSSSSTPQPDTVKDAHGISIKLMGVEGKKVLKEEEDATTQDFILANNPVFFVRSTADYVDLAERLAKGKFFSFFLSWNPFRWHLHELFNMLSATQKSVSNPLQIRYWSQTAYKLGPHAVKYSVKPRSDRVDPMPSSRGPNYLQEVMERQLRSEGTFFDFMVQTQTDPVAMPVEDPTQVWDESLSPFQTVATISIQPQEFNTPERVEFAENLSFTPWHSLPEHRPLGSANRVRRVVYISISRLRHQMNHAPREEPDPT